MEQHLYLGTTELILDSHEPLQLQSFDEKFKVPVLPITRRISVCLTAVQTLPTPAGTAYSTSAMDIWHTADGEYRLYRTAQNEEPWILSHQENAHTIRVMVKQDRWERKKSSFRPWFYIHLEQLLLANHAMVLHSASIICRQKAILFTAPSGTGKTTQTNLWHEFRTGVCDLNGDRTLLQRTDNGWYGCGFPIFGSTVRCEQAAAPIGAIVIIRQASENKITELTAIEKVSWLYSESTIMSLDSDNIHAAMDLLEDLVQNVPILRLDCTMSKRAVDTLEDYLNRL